MSDEKNITKTERQQSLLKARRNAVSDFLDGLNKSSIPNLNELKFAVSRVPC